jgi:hypothetical protein
MRERPSKLKSVLDAFKVMARQEILKHFREDSCIASTKITIRVLEHFGYEAYPQPVDTAIFNPTFVRLVKAGYHPPQDPDALAKWCEVTGAWSVGIGGGEVGHLVAILPKYTLLVDSSISQANRYHHGISLPFVLVEKLAGTDKGLIQATYRVNKCLVRYHFVKDRSTYLNSPNWKYKSQTDEATYAIIRYIEPRL